MVHAPTLQAMREYYREHVQEWSQTHPSQHVVIEGGIFEGFEVKFFRTKISLNKYLRPHRNMIGGTSLVEKIPKKSTHRFNPDNRSVYITNEYIAYCPNDSHKRKKLPNGGIIRSSALGEETQYEEVVWCPDCNCHIFRRPTQRRINELEKHMRDIIVKAQA